jgi:hypothetical protein
MRFVVTAFALLVSLSVAFASEPGQPLDCSDWVFLKPGLSCAVLIPRSHCYDAATWTNPCYAGQSSAADNESNLVTLERRWVGNCVPSGSRTRIELVRYVSGVREVAAYIENRCVDGTGMDAVNWGVTLAGGNLGGLTFDGTGGRVLLSLSTYCDSNSGMCPVDYDGDGNPDSGDDASKLQLVAISGFATTFDVLQTYAPPATLGFRVPYMPDGLRSADHFDTYVGSLAKPIDFTQAQPLQCAYPLTAPHVGDFLTIADPLPDPTPGTGRYYITAATYQGQTRYGRKTTSSHLSGRDPSLLPACVAP